jgi:agmatine/peptidylarginine deiminase
LMSNQLKVLGAGCWVLVASCMLNNAKIPGKTRDFISSMLKIILNANF